MEKHILLVSCMDTGFMPLLAFAMNDFCRRRRNSVTNNYCFESAGLYRDTVGMQANEDIRHALALRGLSLDYHRSRFVGDIDLRPFSHIICTTEKEVSDLTRIVNPSCEVSVIVEDEGALLRTQAFRDEDVELMVKDVFEYAGSLLTYL